MSVVSSRVCRNKKYGGPEYRIFYGVDGSKSRKPDYPLISKWNMKSSGGSLMDTIILQDIPLSPVPPTTSTRTTIYIPTTNTTKRSHSGCSTVKNRFKNFKNGMLIRHKVPQCTTTWQAVFFKTDDGKVILVDSSSGSIFKSFWNMVKKHHEAEDSAFTSRPRSTWDTCEVQTNKDGPWVRARTLRN